MDKSKDYTADKKELRKSVIKAILLMFLFLIIMATIFFIAAGRLNISRAWIFFAAMLVYFLVSIIILYKFNPELLIHRLKRKADAKSWDKILMRTNNLVGIHILVAVAGVDVGRFRWSHLGNQSAILGFVLWIIATTLITWTMAVNKHFEPTLRIQKDRDHQVITTGPYKIVRHPGYLGGVLFYIAIPLIIGSVYGLIPGATAILLTIIRTALEDKTLQNELNGYSKYAQRIKYRLFPGVW